MRKLLVLLLLCPFIAFSQSLPSIAEKTKNLKSFPGFLNFYWDENAGKIYLEVNRLDSEMLYQTSLPAGLGSNDVGLDRGKLGKTAIVKFTRVGNKVLLTQPNYDYRAVTNNTAEKRAVEQSFAQSVLWGFVAEAEGNGTVLIDATPFLLRDALHVAADLITTKQGTYTLDATRSAMYLPQTKNFPLNTEFESSVTFITKDPRPGDFVATVTPDAEAITLRTHHSFVQLPDNNYTPRAFDPRSGFIPISYFDYSTPITENIEKKYITRHRLQKKDPSAAMSEAIKPIVYYLDNGTPEPIRSALLEGAQWWNQAFEVAGFKNAFQVKVLPEDADPMDIRYNMINWVHRATRGWSMGMSVVDPRTGEIIKGNVLLGSLRVRQDYLIAQGLLAPFENDLPADNKMLQMALQRLKQLSAHEVGHTLGLMHNYISSTQNQASVMDYPSPMVALNQRGEIDLKNAYTNEIGEWDKVSISYGYKEFAAGSNERAALNNILLSAATRGFTFISDRDARDADGLHPTAHLWDVGKDPVNSLNEIMKIREKALANFGVNNIRKDVPMAMLEDVLVPIYLFHRYQLESVVKLVGGMNYSYALRGDGQIVTTPLSKIEQLKALKAVLNTITPKALALPEAIVQLIPPRPAGYSYNRELFLRKTGLAFDPLGAAEAAADFPLSFLFRPARLNRMIQFGAEGDGLGADEMIQVIINNTWKATPGKGLEGLIAQQNQQLVLTNLLKVYASDEASYATKAVVLKAIEDIKTMVSTKLKSAGTAATDKGYLLLTLDRITNKDKAKPFLPWNMPPGAPIGCEMD